MKSNPVVQETIRLLAGALQQAGHGGGGALKAKAMSDLGISNSTLHRLLKEVRVCNPRKQRADKTTSALTYAEAELISAYLMAGTRANGKRIVSIKQAVADLRANGKIAAARTDPETGEVKPLSESTIARGLHQFKLHPDQLNRPAPHVRLASLHPNHVWQIDASVCVLFYLPSKGLQVMSDKEFYKNKPQNFEKIKNERVIRYVCTDHASGTVQVRYYPGAETGDNLADFFIYCIQPKENQQEPIHGVPLILMDDAGSANTSHLFNNLLKRLVVDHLTHKPGNPRASGSVERGQNLVECGFESRLGVGQKVTSLDDLNEKAGIWARHFNAVELHSRHGKTRYDTWMHIKADQLRIAPSLELCRMLLTTKPETRVIEGDLCISYAPKGWPSRRYSVEQVPGVLVGDKVTVCVSPYTAPAVNVIEIDADGKEIFYECQPIAKGDFGFPEDAVVIGNYKAVADTPADTARKKGKKIAYGVTTQEEVDTLQRKKVRPFADIDPFSHLKENTATYLERKGTDMDIKHPIIETKPWSHTKTALELARRGMEMTPERNRMIAQWYPGGVPESELDALQARIVARPTLRAVS